jgi:hypothetical protein
MLKVQTAQNTPPRKRYVVLDELLWHARLRIAALLPGFNEEATLVAENAGFDDQYTGKFCLYYVNIYDLTVDCEYSIKLAIGAVHRKAKPPRPLRVHPSL